MPLIAVEAGKNDADGKEDAQDDQECDFHNRCSNGVGDEIKRLRASQQRAEKSLITYEKEINLLTYFYHSPMVIAKSCSFLL